MRLRFAKEVVECADPVGALERADYTCRWTGFRSSLGMRAYVEEDGTDTVACSASFGARHAGMLDATRHALVWVPEITQADVANIARLHALAQRTYRWTVPQPKDQPETEQKAETNRIRDALAMAYARLKDRAGVVERMPDDSRLPLADLLPMLPEDARSRLLDGLRVLPLGFGSREISAWVAEGASMHGVAVERAFERHWYAPFTGDGPAKRTWLPASSPPPVGPEPAPPVTSSDFEFDAEVMFGEPAAGPKRTVPVLSAVSPAEAGPVPSASEDAYMHVPALRAIVDADGAPHDADTEVGRARLQIDGIVRTHAEGDRIRSSPYLEMLVAIATRANAGSGDDGSASAVRTAPSPVPAPRPGPAAPPSTLSAAYIESVCFPYGNDRTLPDDEIDARTKLAEMGDGPPVSATMSVLALVDCVEAANARWAEAIAKGEDAR